MRQQIFLTAFLAVCACLLVPGWTSAEEPQRADRCATPFFQNSCDAEAERPEAEREILRKLDTPVLCAFRKPLSLAEMLKWLSEQSDAPMLIDYVALREADIDPETTMIALSLPNEINLKTALLLALQQHDLAYVVEDEVLKITTKQAAKEKLYQRVYYVGDLVPADTVKAAEFAETLSQTAGEMAKAAKFHDAEAVQALNGMIQQAVQKYEAATQPDFEQIIDIITTVVDPDSWDKNGTEILEYYPTRSLVIRQTEEVHAEIVDLLGQLRILNTFQICYRLEYVPLSGYAVQSEIGQPARVAAFNGMTAEIEMPNEHQDFLVRVVPVSATPIDPKLEAENRPIYCTVPTGKKLTVQGVVSNDRTSIKVTASVEGEPAKTRSFHAAPLIPEAEETCLCPAGFSVTKTPDVKPVGVDEARAVMLQAYAGLPRENEAGQKVSILPPLNEKPDCLPAPPSDEEVLTLLDKVNPVESLVPGLETTYRTVKGIEKQLISDFVDPPRTLPLVGPVQIHHFHYKCTVHFTETTRVGWPIPHTIKNGDCVEVLYIDKDHFHRIEQNAEVAEMTDAETESPVLQVLEDTLIRPVGGVFEQFDNLRLDQAIRHAVPLATPPRPGR